MLDAGRVARFDSVASGQRAGDSVNCRGFGAFVKDARVRPPGAFVF